jgi:hypothetical protein
LNAIENARLAIGMQEMVCLSSSLLELLGPVEEDEVSMLELINKSKTEIEAARAASLLYLKLTLVTTAWAVRRPTGKLHSFRNKR